MASWAKMVRQAHGVHPGARKQDREQADYGERSHQAELFSGHREHEIGMGFGQIALHLALTRPHACKPAPADGVDGHVGLGRAGPAGRSQEGSDPVTAHGPA